MSRHNSKTRRRSKAGSPAVRVPPAEIPPDLLDGVIGIHGRPLNVDRALANQAALLGAWIDLAVALRARCVTSPALRELLILRVAQLHCCEYVLHEHLEGGRAAAAGIEAEKVRRLACWRDSPGFDEAERLVLEYGEAVSRCVVSDELDARVSARFSPSEKVELAFVAAFYSMVARFLEAIRVPHESEIDS